MDRMIVVFGTTAIYSERPSYPGQRPVYEEGCAVHGYRTWSTGKLENAIAQENAVTLDTLTRESGGGQSASKGT